MYVARGIVRFGSRASSPKIAVASKPMKDETTNTSATPRPGENTASAPNGANAIGLAGLVVTRMAMLSMSRMAISASMQAPSSRPLNSILPTPHSKTAIASPPA